MIYRNRFIYHCITCGHVDRRDQEADSPVCCGRVMTNAATVADQADDSEELKFRSHARTGASGDRGVNTPLRQFAAKRL